MKTSVRMLNLRLLSVGNGLGDVIPSRSGLRDNARHVILQEIAFGHEIVRSLGDLGQVLIAAAITLFDRAPRIARLIALRLGSRQRDERSLHAGDNVDGP